MAAKTSEWTADSVPDQRGRTAVITGANSGIGLEAARVLAEHSAKVVLACRSTERAKDAAVVIARTAPKAAIETQQLDLGSLSSVRTAAETLRSAHSRIDLLINNAGVMWTPEGRTADGFELQFGTNHLGHFALTGLLLDRLLPVPGSRVITVSSGGHRAGRIHFDNLNLEGHYGRMRAYGQAKLANLLFTYELQRRLAGAGAPTIAVAAHPGAANPNLARHAPAIVRVSQPLIGPLLSQSPAMGALPTLRAATDPDVRGGEYYGPSGRFEQRGYPVRVDSNARSHDVAVQRRLWLESERLTGVTYPV